MYEEQQIVNFATAYCLSPVCIGVWTLDACLHGSVLRQPMSTVWNALQHQRRGAGMVKVKCKYANQKPICDFLFDVNSFLPCRRFRDICSGNVHNLELENEPRSNTNMPIESRCVTFYLLTILMIFSSVTVLQDNHVWTPQCYPFESLVLKMKFKDVDDFDEDWQLNFVNMHICARFDASRRSRLFLVTFRGRRTSTSFTYVRTYVLT